MNLERLPEWKMIMKYLLENMMELRNNDFGQNIFLIFYGWTLC